MNIGRTLFFLNAVFDNLSQPEKEEFAEGINELLEKHDLVEEKSIEEQLIDAIGGDLINKIVNSVDDSDKEESTENWITIAKAAEKNRGGKTTIGDRIKDGKLSTQLINGVTHVLESEVLALKVITKKKPKVKKEPHNKATPEQTAERREAAINILYRNGRMTFKELQEQLMTECDFSDYHKPKNAVNSARWIIRNLITDNIFNWHRIEGNTNTTPSIYDDVSLVTDYANNYLLPLVERR